MVLLPGDLIHAVLQTLEATPRQLSVLNGLKAVSKQWLLAARRVLRGHAGSAGMLALFRHDCANDMRGLALPMRCRISPYASTAGLTVQSAVDGAGVLERSVEAVLWEAHVETEACCIYAEPGEASCECAWHEEECPCKLHFEEVRADTYDPGFCLAKLKITSMRLEVGGRFYGGGRVFSCAKEAMRTKFGEEEIEDAVTRGDCAHDSLLLGCVHVGCEFNGRWLSVGLLRVLDKLRNGEEGVLCF